MAFWRGRGGEGRFWVDWLEAARKSEHNSQGGDSGGETKVIEDGGEVGTWPHCYCHRVTEVLEHLPEGR